MSMPVALCLQGMSTTLERHKEPLKLVLELMTEVQGGEMAPLSFPPHPPRGLPVALTAPEGLTAEKAAILWPILLEVSIHIL